MSDEKTATLKELIISLTCSIDLLNFVVKHHHQRVAIIAAQIGKEYGLGPESISKLVFAASLHDIGAISALERDELLRLDVEDPIEHAKLGAKMLGPFPYFEPIVPIITCHHCRWENGAGVEFQGIKTPIESFILHLADRVDVILNQKLWVLDEKEIVRKEILMRSGRLFKPDVVEAFMRISQYDVFWLQIENLTLEELLNDVLEEEESITLTVDILDSFALTISHIIDFRSKFTAAHSIGVGFVAYQVGKIAGYSEESCKKLRIAGFLHDFGKVAIANEIIDKTEPLNESEYNQIRAHSFYTHKILGNIKSISDICLWASMHHERHDGSGYPYGLKESDFCEEIDIVACSDVFTALRENRQYRAAYPLAESLELMTSKFRNKLGNKILDLVLANAEELDKIREEVQKNAIKYFTNSIKDIIKN